MVAGALQDLRKFAVKLFLGRFLLHTFHAFAQKLKAQKAHSNLYGELTLVSSPLCMVSIPIHCRDSASE
jgi:hypothetical protein